MSEFHVGDIVNINWSISDYENHDLQDIDKNKSGTIVHVSSFSAEDWRTKHLVKLKTGYEMLIHPSKLTLRGAYD